jgi:hypothetical protein
MFSGRRPHKSVKFVRRFKDWFCPHIQGVAHGMVEPKLLSAISYILKIGKESVPETSENLHSLARLSAPEHFMNFCCRESPKTENTYAEIVFKILKHYKHEIW